MYVQELLNKAIAENIVITDKLDNVYTPTLPLSPISIKIRKLWDIKQKPYIVL